MNVPGGAVLHCDTVKNNILTVVQKDHSRTPRDALYFGIMPPVFAACTAVYRPLSCDHDILHIDTRDDACKHIERIAFPCAEQVFFFLVNTLDLTWQNREFCSVCERGERRVLSDLQHQITLQKKRADPVHARWYVNPSTLGTCVDGTLYKERIICLAVALRPKIPDVQRDILLRSRDAERFTLIRAAPDPYLICGRRLQPEHGRYVPVAPLRKVSVHIDLMFLF